MTVDELKLGIGVTVAGWAALLAYFPQDPHGKALIMRLVESLVVPRGNPDQKALFTAANRLGWLNEAMVNQVGEWKGAKGLRALYCSKFPPADGFEGEDEPVFTRGEIAQTQRLLAEVTPSHLLLEPGEAESAKAETEALVRRTVKRSTLVLVTDSDRKEAREWADRNGL